MQALINFLARFINATKDAFNVQLSGSILAQDTTSGENVELSSIADTDGKNVLRTVDAAPFAYDTVSLAKRVTQAKKDIVAKATDDIINTIKLENIKMFLRMDEVSGATAYDLINRDIQFDIRGNPLLAQNGPFGNCIYFDGADDYLIQKPITRNFQSVGLLWGVLDTANTKIATRMNAISTVPGIVRLRLKRVGTLDSATLKVSIYGDSADAPGTLVASATSETLACTQVGTTSEERGFVFNDTTLYMSKDKKYWLVLEYDDSTGVDASNYVAWAYEKDNTYGERSSLRFDRKCLGSNRCGKSRI